MSVATTITDLAVIAGYNRGPLTTAFSVPPACLSTLTFVDGHMYFGHAGTDYYSSSCYPSSYSSTYTLLADNGNWNQYYYSPARCPEAWAQATTFTSYVTNPADTSGQVLFSLGSNTTAVLCCPSGYSYFGAGHQCGATVESSGAELIYATTSLSNNAVVLGIPATTTITTFPYTIWGDGIPIWWQSSDSAAFSAAPAQTTASTGPTSTSTGNLPTATSTDGFPPTPNSGSSSLSSGAKAAIGVTLPVVVIVVILGIFFYFRRHEKRRIRQDSVGSDKSKYINDRGELATDGALSELENHPLQQHYELPDR